jgi:hypothetical protein
VRDLTVLIDMEVGQTPRLLDETAAAGIRLVAGCVFPRLGGRVVHFAVRDDDVAAFTGIVEEAGGTVADTRECLLVPPGFPGGPAGAVRAVSEAGVVVNLAYLGVRGELVMATSDIDATRRALDMS